MRATRLSSRIKRRRFRQWAIWAMVPLVSLGGLPTAGCICADGSYTTNCPALRKGAAESTSQSGCCQVSCCAADEADTAIRSCCQATADARADSSRSKPDDRSHCVANRSGCCHVVIHAGMLPPLSDFARVVNDHQVPALLANALEPMGLLSAMIDRGYVKRDTGQPTCDLVITLRRLVI